MTNKKKVKSDKKRKLRNITDYIFDCIRRLEEHADLLLYLGKNKLDFIDDESKNSPTIIISMVDVYSRDTVVIINNILDENPKTSSLFTLIQEISDDKKQKKYLKRLKTIKNSINEIVKARSNQVAHFQTKVNDTDYGFLPINRIFEVDPRYTKKILKKIENLYWDIKEELSIDGVFRFWKGEHIAKSFARLTAKNLG